MKIRAFLILVLLELSSCCEIFNNCDDCKNITCKNGGTCADGKCNCPAGFSGDFCENSDQFSTGWISEENSSEIPVSITSSSFFSNSNLPSSVDLSQKFPPVGNQGQYGTCVAWAVGYNSKSAMEAIAQNLTPSDLQSSSRQMSPKDLFLSIPNNLKGTNCNGTQFTYAMDQLLQRGAATLSAVPYTNLEDCSQGANSAANSDAANHKIKNYRRIDVGIDAIKEQLANRIPVIFGALIYESFMNIRGDGVYTANSGRQSGAHAMVVVGYDDSKGSQGAFKILNSWGTSWGNYGYTWIDYSFMVNNFIYDGNCYIMTQDGGIPPPDVDPDDPPVEGSSDLASWVNFDFSNYNTSGFIQGRSINFNVYNIGSSVVNSNKNWSFYYLYYDAFNANNYGVIFYDQFNTSVASNSFTCPTGNNCVFNYSMPGGSNFSTVVFNMPSVTRDYLMPQITGYYYLVLIADATNAVSEVDETNNFFYTSIQLPKYFQNGYSQRQRNNGFKNDENFESNKLLKSFYYNRAVKDNQNAYSSDEILQFIKEQKKSGKLDLKLREFNTSNGFKNIYHQ